MSDAPVFVVVGNVNQGKSSIVATLAEDPSIPIASQPGTTQKSGEYVFGSGDRTLFRLIDTPGFQEARAALAWMRERSFSAMDHPDVVRSFVEEHTKESAFGQASTRRFQDEVRLLRPILDGASVLYVVDASAPPQPSNEAEMEILRWTGRPGMALINQTRERDHADAWRPYLEQFFNVVRRFDAQGAGFDERMGLLRGFREVREDWQTSLDEAIALMERERRHRRDRAASVIAELVARALSHIERRRLDDGAAIDDVRSEVENAYLTALRDAEANARAEVEAIYRHRRVDREEPELALHDADLFSDTSWRAFGLTRSQLAQYGAAWGAAIGAAIDLMVGGLSFFLGAAIGAATGGITGFLGGTRVARTWGDKSKLARALFPGETGRYLAMGPATSPRFAWMLVDRALVHHAAIRDRAHARRDALEVPEVETERQGLATSLEGGLRSGIDRELQRILKRALKGRPTDEPEARLKDLLKEAM